MGILPSQPSGSFWAPFSTIRSRIATSRSHLAADALEVAATHVVADAGEPQRLRPGQVPPAGLRLESADAQLVVAGVADRVGDVLVDPAQRVDHPGEPVHVDRRPVVDRQVDEIADDAGQDRERLVALLPAEPFRVRLDLRVDGVQLLAIGRAARQREVGEVAGQGEQRHRLADRVERGDDQRVGELRVLPLGRVVEPDEQDVEPLRAQPRRGGGRGRRRRGGGRRRWCDGGGRPGGGRWRSATKRPACRSVTASRCRRRRRRGGGRGRGRRGGVGETSRPRVRVAALGVGPAP